MSYIKRDLESKIEELSMDYAAIMLIGPRQVGKTTLLREITEEKREYVTLDDFDERKLAKEDPEYFLSVHKTPILVDEVQYAPELFSYIKIAIDAGAKPGTFWLTGSQSFRIMELAQESLAGRVAIVHMSSLSQNELYGDGENSPFTVDLEDLKGRESKRKVCDVSGIFERIFEGSLPGYRSGKFKDRDVFYSSYVQTYIDRDITELAGNVDKFAMSDFIRACACRCSCELNLHQIAVDVGVSDNTAKNWLKVLEQSEIIFYLRPYSNNLLNRTIKSPKMYFFDTGLVAYLTKYESPQTLMSGALSGAIFENYVVAELRKSYQNSCKSPALWYYRDKDKREIDLVLESNGVLYPIEIKKSSNPRSGATSAFAVLDRAPLERGQGAIICMKENLGALNRESLIVPAWVI